MPNKRNIDKSLFDYKPVNVVNGLPWPRLPSDFNPLEKVDVPLKEEYLLRSMDYLDTDQAKPIFEKQADIIIENKIKGIIDVGCRIGILNDILYERGYTKYNYMGFDTSSQPINYAKEVWSEFDNIEYRCASMYDKDSINVDFDVDCVVWSGVLLYNPDNHMQLFEELTVDYYKANHAIIQEPCKKQDPKKFLQNMKLNTIEQDMYLYKEKYTEYKDWIINAEIFSGRRRIAHIWI